MIFKISSYHIISLNASSKIDIGLLWNLTYLFAALGLVYFFIIFYLKNKELKRTKKVVAKRAELAPIISNFLFHAPDDPIEEQKEYINLKIEIRDYLRSKDFRNLLSEILFDLQKDVSGSTEERLYKLYRELELHHDAYEKVRSYRWHIVSKGILELTDMKVTESYQIISKFINHKRGAIRKQAEIATVKMRHEGINYILDYTRFSISEWQQIKLIEALSNLKDYEPPKFKAWLISNNKDVVLFALRLIQHYNQNDAEAAIIELLKHQNQQIRLEAVNCIKDFNFTNAKPILKRIFPHCENELKIQILDVFCELGDKQDLDFLNEIIGENDSFLVTSKAGSAVNNIMPDSILPTINIDNDLISESKEKVKIDEDVKITPQETSLKNEEEDKVITNTIKVEPTYILNDKEEIHIELELHLDEDQFITEAEKTSKKKEVEEEDIITEVNKSLTLNEYQLLNDDQRRQFIEKFVVEGETDENDFLEMILEEEVSNDLRFLIFQKIKSINEGEKIKTLFDEEVQKTDNPDSEVFSASVFSPLFKKASDDDSKLILIKQMVLLGDEKELSFLRSLKQTEHGRIKIAITKAIADLEKKFESMDLIDPVESIEVEMIENHDTDNKEEVQTNPEEVHAHINDMRLPLEFCFLDNEMVETIDISERSSVFDFELSDEFFN